MKLRLVVLAALGLFAVACESDSGSTGGHGNGNTDTVDENDTAGGGDVTGGGDGTTLDWNTTDDPTSDTTPTGLSCMQFYSECVPSCPTDAQGQADQACAQQCMSQLTPQGSTDLNNFQNCMSAAGCFSAASQDAMFQCLETRVFSARLLQVDQEISGFLGQSRKFMDDNLHDQANVGQLQKLNASLSG